MLKDVCDETTLFRVGFDDYGITTFPRHKHIIWITKARSFVLKEHII